MKKLLFEELLLEYNKAYMYSWTNDRGLVDRFWKIKIQLGNRQEADINWWIQNKTPQDFEKFINNYESGNFKTNTQIKKSEKSDGAQIVYDDHKYWRVYFVTNYEAAKQLGSNTKWCITGKHSAINGDSSGKYYFINYIKRHKLKNRGYYFCFDLTKRQTTGDYDKYCILVNADNKVVSIWNSEDEQIDALEVSNKVAAVQFIPDVKIPYNFGLEKVIFGGCEWLVIDDQLDSQTLLFNDKKEAVDIKFTKKPTKDTCWATCDLRRWLNNYFIKFLISNGANTDMLIETDVLSDSAQASTATLQGPSTKDRVWLLSSQEAHQLGRQYLNYKADYWLRTMTQNWNVETQEEAELAYPFVQFISSTGRILASGCDPTEELYIRPIIKIKK